jgi:hypothetical protein
MIVEYLAMMHNNSGTRIPISPQEAEKIRLAKKAKHESKHPTKISEPLEQEAAGLFALFEEAPKLLEVEIVPFNLNIILDFKNQSTERVLEEINKSDFNIHSIPLEILGELIEVYGENILLNVASWISSYESDYDSLESIFNYLFENQKLESEPELVFLLAKIIKLIENLTSLLILEGKLPLKHRMSRPINLDLLILQHYDELLNCKDPQIAVDEFPSLKSLLKM